MKYFEAIREAQRNGKPAAELPPFDMSRLETRSVTGRLVSRFLENPRWALRPSHAVARRSRHLLLLANPQPRLAQAAALAM